MSKSLRKILKTWRHQRSFLSEQEILHMAASSSTSWWMWKPMKIRTTMQCSQNDLLPAFLHKELVNKLYSPLVWWSSAVYMMTVVYYGLMDNHGSREMGHCIRSTTVHISDVRSHHLRRSAKKCGLILFMEAKKQQRSRLWMMCLWCNDSKDRKRKHRVSFSPKQLVFWVLVMISLRFHWKSTRVRLQGPYVNNGALWWRTSMTFMKCWSHQCICRSQERLFSSWNSMGIELKDFLRMTALFSRSSQFTAHPQDGSRPSEEWCGQGDTCIDIKFIVWWRQRLSVADQTQENV